MADFYFFFDVDEDHPGDDTLSKYSENTFESIKHTDENDNEDWLARELQRVLNYKSWNKFLDVISKAEEACENSGISVSECFSRVGKTSPMPKGGFKEIGDIKLNRYACYLIVQNEDPTKEVIALGQTYFAVKTR